MIGDTQISNTFQRIRNGEINKEQKTYVFLLKNGTHFEVLAKNELEAWEMIEANGKDASELTRIERQSFHGLSYYEVIAEAQKRGLDHG